MVLISVVDHFTFQCSTNPQAAPIIVAVTRRKTHRYPFQWSLTLHPLSFYPRSYAS